MVEEPEQPLTRRQQYRTIKVACTCGREIRRNDLNAHLMTYQHVRLSNGVDPQVEPANIMVRCSCGFEVAKNHMTQHLESERHKEGADPEKIDCECGCTFKNQKCYKHHLKTEKHTIMLNNGGDLKAYQKLIVRRGVITDCKNNMKKLDENSDEWKMQSRLLKRLEEEMSMWLRSWQTS